MAKRKKKKGKPRTGPLPGITLETVVARIQQMMDPASQVTHNEQLEDRVGNTRQFDVVIRGTFAGRPMLGVIECKDHNRKKGPDAVEAFAMKSQHLGANLRLMVSRKGFSKQALRLAKHESIGCLSLLPSDPRQAGFSVGSFWYGVIKIWKDVRLTVNFDKERPANFEFKTDEVRWQGLPVVRWFLRELFLRYAHDKNEGRWQLRCPFKQVKMIEIKGREYPVKELSCEAVWFTANKRKWVSWSGDAFYDWHRQAVCLPNKATLVASPVPSDIFSWDDYDGEIPDRAQNDQLLVVGYVKQRLADDEPVPELGDL